MKTTKENLYLLYAIPYKESDLIANFLSPEEGKLTARIFGGKKIGNSKSFFYSPGDLLSVEYQKKENNEFVKILNISANTLIGVDQLPYDRFIFHSYLLELIGRIIKVGNPVEELFQLIKTNNDINWASSTKLPFILWSLWSVVNSGGFAIDYNSCARCDRPSWKPDSEGGIRIHKEFYQLIQNSGQLECGQCSQPGSSSLVITGAMIKILWLLEHQANFYTDDNKIPPKFIIDSIHHMNQYLLLSYNIKPNSLGMFVKSLEKY
ncbi:MAG: hypothetical protein GY786_11405 [Proteobacteria bacterium]|nr:hypothetical protein [Pseudomonadota bacterium]